MSFLLTDQKFSIINIRFLREISVKDGNVVPKINAQGHKFLSWYELLGKIKYKLKTVSFQAFNTNIERMQGNKLSEIDVISKIKLIKRSESWSQRITDWVFTENQTISDCFLFSAASEVNYCICVQLMNSRKTFAIYKHLKESSKSNNFWNSMIITLLMIWYWIMLMIDRLLYSISVYSSFPVEKATGISLFWHFDLSKVVYSLID